MLVFYNQELKSSPGRSVRHEPLTASNNPSLCTGFCVMLRLKPGKLVAMKVCTNSLKTVSHRSGSTVLQLRPVIL